MDISGLENNYYLVGNDIWISVSNFPKVPIKLELQCTNINSGKTLSLFRLYPNPLNVFRFNLSQTIRPLQPFPDHTDVNSLQKYKMDFAVVFEDETSETISYEKFFIRGGRPKNNVDEWYLSDGYKLVISKWVDWNGIALPGYANKIQSSQIVEYIPTIAETYKMNVPSICNAKIVKFLNSLGGYQYWVFEAYEIETKVKSKKAISLIADRLRGDRARSIGTEPVEEITLKTKVPIELQPIIIDLIKSPEVFMYDPAGTDDLSRWTRLILSGGNDAILNSTDGVYSNEISYTLPNYVNRDI